ncbi:MAG: PstS family phosphate ABC transporter substrate-binding protein [Anaerolineaceae bacterium]|nr:PstS family phosphate ABC transporter substrate-binding protein [Anaerolineaceae bacterium]
MNRSLRSLLVLLLVILMVTACGQSNSQSGADGRDTPSLSIQNKGSDTMVNLALYWAEQYQQEHAEVSISVTGGGSGTGITAMISNTVDIANASRAIKPEEREQALANGVDPVEHVVARDAIAVIINPENPIQKLTLQQVSDIYSGRINNWKELGGDYCPIVRLSRETNSGTHVYFLESVIRLGNKKDETLFSMDTLLLPSSEGIIAEVRDNPNAIGYDGLGYVTPEVKVVALARDASSGYIMPSVETVNQNLYPVARDLYMYTNGQPQGLIAEYLAWIHSSAGQQIVEDLGFVPVD